MMVRLILLSTAVALTSGYVVIPSKTVYSSSRCSIATELHATPSSDTTPTSSRRTFLATAFGSAAAVATAATTLATTTAFPQPSNAIGPVKIDLLNPQYSAMPCPKDKPIPGEKAMKGLKGMCVTVKAELGEESPKDLEKVGVYGFVTDAKSDESVLANNPDLSTDAGQFSMIEAITPSSKKVEFEFVAAIPKEIDTDAFERGIPDLSFKSLRVISFPGGQQYGAINPCEMNEFSDECEAWEDVNGPYVKGDFMTKSNPRTKGR